MLVCVPTYHKIRPVTTRSTSPLIMEASIDPSEASVFAERHLAAVLEEARQSVPAGVNRVRVPASYVTFQSAATLFAAITIAGATAGALDSVCWPAASSECAADPVLGIGSGLLGAVAIRLTEAWRLDVAPSDDAYEREISLSHSILLASAPLSLVSRLGVADATVGERASALIVDGPKLLPAAALHLAGTTAACAWAHGVVQQTLTAELTDVALKNAMRKRGLHLRPAAVPVHSLP